MGPQEHAGVMVDHHREVLVAPLVADLVDADAARLAKRSVAASASATTRVRIEPTVRQATRSSSLTADFEQWVTSHEQVSSENDDPIWPHRDGFELAPPVGSLQSDSERCQ